MPKTFLSSVSPPEYQNDLAYWFIFKGQKLLVIMSEDGASIPCVRNPIDLGIKIVRQQFLGSLINGLEIHCYSAESATEASAREGMEFHGLRSLYGLLDDDLFWLAGRAIQIVDWDRTHQFCSRCGSQTETMPHERAKQCPQCGFTSYPRLSPAIIVRVQREGPAGPEILLARSQRYPDGMYSVLAGFVEPGETLEECVRREVMEEVGVELENIRYFGSQPWPFPNSLMLAFTADYAGGEIVLEEEEIADAKWFSADSLPRIPAPISISRQLINSFLDDAGQ
jgi:NAD+ diphosphatase